MKCFFIISLCVFATVCLQPGCTGEDSGDDAASDFSDHTVDDSADDTSTTDEVTSDFNKAFNEKVMVIYKWSNIQKLYAFVANRPYTNWQEVRIPYPSVDEYNETLSTSQRALKTSDGRYLLAVNVDYSDISFDYYEEYSTESWILALEGEQWSVLMPQSSIPVMGHVVSIQPFGQDLYSLAANFWFDFGPFGMTDISLAMGLIFNETSSGLDLSWFRFAHFASYSLGLGQKRNISASSRNGEITVLGEWEIPYLDADPKFYFLMHWDGASWRETYVPLTDSELNTVWNVGPDEDYLTGSISTGDQMLHRVGSTFTGTSAPAPCDGLKFAPFEADDGTPLMLFPGIGYAYLDDQGIWQCDQSYLFPSNAEAIIGAASKDLFFYRVGTLYYVYRDGVVEPLPRPTGQIRSDIINLIILDD